jgi:hypothetical protein
MAKITTVSEVPVSEVPVSEVPVSEVLEGVILSELEKAKIKAGECFKALRSLEYDAPNFSEVDKAFQLAKIQVSKLENLEIVKAAEKAATEARTVKVSEVKNVVALAVLAAQTEIESDILAAKLAFDAHVENFCGKVATVKAASISTEGKVTTTALIVDIYKKLSASGMTDKDINATIKDTLNPNTGQNFDMGTAGNAINAYKRSIGLM